MSQMSPAVTAHNLRARHPESAVRMSRHSARDRVKIRRPAAAGFEFVRCFVDGRVACCACIDPGGGHMFVKDACVGLLGAFFAKDAELL